MVTSPDVIIAEAMYSSPFPNLPSQGGDDM
jgi:hypothetical protein